MRLLYSNTFSATKPPFLGDGLQADKAAQDIEGNSDVGFKVRDLALSFLLAG